ncbi:ribosome-inactivating protein cucurmosin-like [Euphorbia lathyris]|uniref:ribosome-inactivating protein cucurmosin-like n=1 Tax=Euphorbia lathyris TaxID=212925 RepID=UPI0033141053
MLKTITLVSCLFPPYSVQVGKMKKMLMLLATWLCCNIAIGSCQYAAITYPSVSFTTHLASDGSYRSLMSSLRKELDSNSESHEIPILRKPSEITDKNKYLLVNLINNVTRYDVTLAITVVNVYVIGFKSGGNSFFLSDAPSDATKLLFDGTSKKKLTLGTNYASLGDRSKVGLGIGPLKKAIDTLYSFNGVVTTEVKNSLLVVIQMVAEAGRFQYIQKQIENELLGEYKPKSDTISLENSWDALSKQIQQCGRNGIFTAPVTLKNADGSNKIISSVSQVKPDISILLYYKGSGKTVEEERSGEILAEEVVEKWLSVL